jgi:hypothetical protein
MTAWLPIQVTVYKAMCRMPIASVIGVERSQGVSNSIPNIVVHRYLSALPSVAGAGRGNWSEAMRISIGVVLMVYSLLFRFGEGRGLYHRRGSGSGTRSIWLLFDEDGVVGVKNKRICGLRPLQLLRWRLFHPPGADNAVLLSSRPSRSVGSSLFLGGRGWRTRS